MLNILKTLENDLPAIVPLQRSNFTHQTSKAMKTAIFLLTLLCTLLTTTPQLHAQVDEHLSNETVIEPSDSLIIQQYRQVSFISSIKQECIIVFDEFEKVFDDDEGEQDALLSLFDGIDSGKKLYVITCNAVAGLSEYLLNRPGRFHYHFTFGTLTSEEIRGYLEDNLNNAAKSQLESVIQLGMVTGFTYDILRAITFELNQGYGLEETLQDLNVSQDDNLMLRIYIKFTNGVTTADDFRNDCPINLHRSAKDFQWYTLSFSRDSLPEKLRDADDRDWLPEIRVYFKRADLKVKSGNFYIDKDKVNIQLRDQFIDNDCSEELRKLITEFKSALDVEEITLARRNKDITKQFFY